MQKVHNTSSTRKISKRYFSTCLNYRILFINVKKTIDNFMRDTYGLKNIAIFHKNYITQSIYDADSKLIYFRFIDYIESKHILHTTLDKSLYIIGFTIWSGYGCKFPRRLHADNFSILRCKTSIDYARTECMLITRCFEPTNKFERIVSFHINHITKIFESKLHFTYNTI